jgi:hypothetical protein
MTRILDRQRATFILAIISSSLDITLAKPRPSSILPILHPDKQSSEEQGVLYLEKRNSNASYFDVISSLTPSELRNDGTKSFYEPPPVHVLFSHQQKTEPIEIVEISSVSGSPPENSSSSKKSANETVPKTFVFPNTNQTTTAPPVASPQSFVFGSEAPTAAAENASHVNEHLESELPLHAVSSENATETEVIHSIKSNIEKVGSDNKENPLAAKGTADETISLRGGEKVALSTRKGLSPEDNIVRKAWGGSCTMESWNSCSHIKSWGGDYFIEDKKNPGKMILKHHEINCFQKSADDKSRKVKAEEDTKYYCLRNGWTVSRCHLLCMSQCNNCK